MNCNAYASRRVVVGAWCVFSEIRLPAFVDPEGGIPAVFIVFRQRTSPTVAQPPCAESAVRFMASTDKRRLTKKGRSVDQ